MTPALTQAQRLQFARHQIGMNQTEFADYVGVSVQSMNMWETEYRELSLGTARKLKARTPYGLDFFLDGDVSAFNSAQMRALNEWLDNQSASASSE